MGRTTIRHGFVSQDFQIDEAIGLEAKTRQADKQTWVVDVVPTLINFPAMPAYFRAVFSHITVAEVRPRYEKYRCLADNLTEASG